jgi:hypothetical protein
MFVSRLAYSSTLNREARCPSEISVDFQRTTRLHDGFLFGLFFNPEDGGEMFLRNID